MKLNKQLLFKFNNKKNFNYNDFYVTKSNFYAFNLVNNWPKWEKNIINIHGEKYSGKSHLSQIFIKKNKGIIIPAINFKSGFENKLRFHQNIPPLPVISKSHLFFVSRFQIQMVHVFLLLY